MQTMPKELENFMGQQLTAQMLKFHCGSTIFCPGCENILDWRSSVSIDFRGVTSGKLHATQILCANCADKLLPGIQGRLDNAEKKAGEKIRVETTNGRDWNEDQEYDPVPCPQVGGAVHFRAARKDNPQGELVSGLVVLGGLPDWSKFAVYENKTFWWVCELRTGYAVSHGHTQHAALVVALRWLRKVGQDKFKKLLASVPVLNAD